MINCKQAKKNTLLYESYLAKAIVEVFFCRIDVAHKHYLAIVYYQFKYLAYTNTLNSKAAVQVMCRELRHASKNYNNI